MSLHLVPAGQNVPDDINVIIEIPLNAPAIKYEVDKESGALFVDRMLKTAMHYPCNYGYVPDTLCGDGDPVDVMVMMPLPIQPGCVVRCRPVGLLRMTDESGEDAKVLAVPIEEVTGYYKDIREATDLPHIVLDQIAHFFDHYKDLEAAKWVRIEGWEDAEAARREILDGVDRYEAEPDKPRI